MLVWAVMAISIMERGMGGGVGACGSQLEGERIGLSSRVWLQGYCNLFQQAKELLNLLFQVGSSAWVVADSDSISSSLKALEFSTSLQSGPELRWVRK